MTGRGAPVALVLALLALLAAAACGGGDQAELVTTTSRVAPTTAAPTTTAPPLSTTTEAPTTTVEARTESTDPAPDGSEADEIFYRVVRQESTRNGARLFVEILPGDYTDVDLENLVLSVYEERDNLYEVHVFDNREAVEALVKPEAERTSEEAELLDRHYLVSLLEGSILRFQGPFADLEGFIVGS